MCRIACNTLLAGVLVAVALPARGDQMDDLIAQAQTHLRQNDSRQAISLLQKALPSVTSTHRAALLTALRDAYAQALQHAESAGLAAEAQSYRDNLAILTRAAASAPRMPAVTPAAPADSEPAAPPAPPRPTGPPPQPASEPADGLTAEAIPPALRPAEQPPAALTTDPTLGSIRPQAAPTGQVDPAVTPAAAPAPEAPSVPDIQAADAAFEARDYPRAGALYAALDQAGKLPEVRKDPWAYCRMVEVVRQINALPASGEEWQAIQREIMAIRQLSPKNWYAEYLRDLVAELAARSPTEPTDPLVIRGAAPQEPEPAPSARTGQSRSSYSPPGPDAPTIHVGQPGPPIQNWQIWDTPNFRILHVQEGLARQVAQIAESTRQTQLRLWGGVEVTPDWQPRCDIYLYPDATIFQQMTGQPGDAPGFSTMGLGGGSVVARRVNLRADHPNLLAAILPHEITHVVLADVFPNMQIPRWADEGAAVLAEPISEQELRATDLAGPLRDNALFRLSDLLRMDYPDGRYWATYYAQSVSVTRFLFEQGTPQQFIEFVRGIQAQQIEPELKRIYQIGSLDELESQWLSYARRRAALGTQVAEAPGAAAR